MKRFLALLTLSGVGSLGAQARAERLTERATETREIVYFLRQPETHSFDLYHDYTETRAGVDKYLNVVRAGSRVSNPSALILDTGVRLETRTLKGNAITATGLDIGEPVRPETEVVGSRSRRLSGASRPGSGFRRPIPIRSGTGSRATN